MKIFFTFLFLFVITSVQAKTALIFNGAGVCDGCAESVAKLLSEKKFEINYVNEKTLDANQFTNIDIYVQPGGSDDITETTRALTPQQIKLIQNYVQNGGLYLGICAGAYLAGKFADKENNISAFNLIEIEEVNQELNTDRAKLISISTANNSIRKVYYQAGPHYEADKDWYSDDHLTLKYGLNFDLFHEFVNELLK